MQDLSHEEFLIVLLKANIISYIIFYFFRKINIIYIDYEIFPTS